MEVQFANLKELFQAILASEVTFKDEEGARGCINSIADKCAADDEVTLQSLWGSCEADDVTGLLYEKFFYEGYNVDWFDLLRFDFNIDELAITLMHESSLSLNYSLEELTRFVEATVGSWSNNAENFCFSALQDS